MKKHSEPVLYIYLLLVSIILLATAIVSWKALVFTYLFNGFLIWLVSAGLDKKVWKVVFLWFPAILLDKPDMIN